MRWTGFLTLPALLALGAARAADPTILYELGPEMHGEEISALEVTIRLRANASGTTTIDWPSSWAGQHKLGQWARDVRIESALSATPARNGGRIVRSAPSAQLVMRYRIVSAFAADPGVGDSFKTRPIIRPGWFYAVGEVLYASPIERSRAPAASPGGGRPESALPRTPSM